MLSNHVVVQMEVESASMDQGQMIPHPFDHDSLRNSRFAFSAKRMFDCHKLKYNASRNKSNGIYKGRPAVHVRQYSQVGFIVDGRLI